LTQVGFYVLQEDNAAGLLLLACRLAEKAYQRKYRVYLHAPEPDTRRRLDDKLWTFSQGSFVPHALIEEDTAAPVLIGGAEPPPGVDGLLINLAPDVPDFFSRFERLAELVTPDREQRSLARHRYKFYQDRGYTLETHKISL